MENDDKWYKKLNHLSVFGWAMLEENNIAVFIDTMSIKHRERYIYIKRCAWKKALVDAAWRPTPVLNAFCRALQSWLGEQKSDSLLY